MKGISVGFLIRVGVSVCIAVGFKIGVRVLVLVSGGVSVAGWRVMVAVGGTNVSVGTGRIVGVTTYLVGSCPLQPTPAQSISVETINSLYLNMVLGQEQFK